MSMFKKAERKQSKLKLAIEGPSGSGKTYSALVVASGLVGENGKIAVIDSENGSASLYSHLFDFDVCELDNYSPETYIQAIKEAERNYDCVIIDSTTPEWQFLLDVHSKIPGNSYVAWGKVTPRHERFIQTITHAKCHLIATMRSKQAYVMEQNDKGKQAPRKVGLQAQQRDGMEYEFTTVISMDVSHYGMSSKDRTGLFNVNDWFQPSKETGEQLKEWLESGKPPKENRDRELNILRGYAKDKLLSDDEIKSIQDFSKDENWPAFDMFYSRVFEKINNPPKESEKKKKPSEDNSNTPETETTVEWNKILSIATDAQIEELKKASGITDFQLTTDEVKKKLIKKLNEIIDKA